MRERTHAIVDMDNRDAKRQLLAFVGALRGAYEVKIEPRRNTRSLKQNAAYWALVVDPLFRFLTDQHPEVTHAEHAHMLLRAKFLRRTIIDRGTGEVLGQAIRSTTDLTTEEMSDNVERCRAWMWEKLGIATQDPDPLYKTAGRKTGTP